MHAPRRIPALLSLLVVASTCVALAPAAGTAKTTRRRCAPSGPGSPRAARGPPRLGGARLRRPIYPPTRHARALDPGRGPGARLHLADDVRRGPRLPAPHRQLGGRRRGHRGPRRPRALRAAAARQPRRPRRRRARRVDARHAPEGVADGGARRPGRGQGRADRRRASPRASSPAGRATTSATGRSTTRSRSCPATGSPPRRAPTCSRPGSARSTPWCSTGWSASTARTA